MKNIILTTMILVLAQGVTAQDTKKERKERKGNGEYAWIKANLELSEIQKSQLDSINSSLRPDVKGMKELDKKAKKEKRKEIREKKDLAYGTVLSSNQLEKLDTHRAEKKAEKVQKRKEKMEEMDPNAKADEKLTKLKTSLSLSVEQEPAVKQAFVDFYSSQKSIALMPRKSEADKEVIKSKKKEAGKALKTALKETLSKEQLTKMKELNKEKRGERKK